MFTRAFIVMGGVIVILIAVVAALACFTTPVAPEWSGLLESTGVVLALGAIAVALGIAHELTR